MKKHIHKWEKISSDESGAIVMCADSSCEQLAFLETEEAKKFDEAYATQTSVEIELVNPVKK